MTTPLSNADELREQIAVREKINREVEEILGDFVTGSLRLALVNGIHDLITSQKAMWEKEARVDELHLAHADETFETFNEWTILPKYYQHRIAQLSTEDVKES